VLLNNRTVSTAHAAAVHLHLTLDLVLALYQLPLHSVGLVAVTRDWKLYRFSDGSTMVTWDTMGEKGSRDNVHDDFTVLIVATHNESAD
jgi:hypothetical protein